MKKTIIAVLVAVLFSLSSFGQVIDTTVTSMVAVKITPVKASFQDTALSTHLGAYVVSDNLKNSATFYWATLTTQTDSTGKVISTRTTNQGNYTMTAEQYAAWCKDQPCDTWPFTCIGQAYGLTFVVNSSSKK